MKAFCVGKHKLVSLSKLIGEYSLISFFFIVVVLFFLKLNSTFLLKKKKKEQITQSFAIFKIGELATTLKN